MRGKRNRAAFIPVRIVAFTFHHSRGSIFVFLNNQLHKPLFYEVGYFG